MAGSIATTGEPLTRVVRQAIKSFSEAKTDPPLRMGSRPSIHYLHAFPSVSLLLGSVRAFFHAKV